MTTASTKPLFFPAGYPNGPWGVDTIGDQWCVIHVDTLKAKVIGRIRVSGTNHHDRAMAEAARRNTALGVVFVKPDPLNDDAEATRIGKNIAKLLGLRMLTREGRYDTSVGTKTPAGLARTLARVMAGEDL